MYKKITQLSKDNLEFQSTELDALTTIWQERKEELEKSGAYQEFIKKLQREWAIETGIIERLYTWDRGVTEVLIEQGIDSSIISHKGGLRTDKANHVKNIIDDQLNIVEGLFSFVKGDQPLTEHFIRGIQSQFTAHQECIEAITDTGEIVEVKLEKGQYKKLPNNPRRPDGEIHEYCPPEFVKDEMGNLVNWYHQIAYEFPPEIVSSWLHHRFTQIHPFQDGNGRVARALASLIFLKAGLFPLVIRDSDRQDYISALEEADNNNLSALTKLFSVRQRDSILAALGLEQQVKQARYAEDIISSAIEVLRQKATVQADQLNVVFDYADSLRDIANARIGAISDKLNENLNEVTPRDQTDYHARHGSADNDSIERHYFYGQIVEVAKKFKYFANLDRYRSWTRLVIQTKECFEFVISFHGYGHGNNGIMVASAFTSIRVPREEGGAEPANTTPACLDLFQFNYAESIDSIQQRFTEWLESTTAIALAEWKKNISS
ncbi:MAG: Fic family protein [Desulfobulbaceae bacterium]|nr:Fic family protein [Desulfobulbaceae bacterium]HIJ89531.1 Fic family protein [Deltaproteobacteria bacterium]